MGLDGGLIPKRNDMIRKSTKRHKIASDREKKYSSSESFWTICSLSGAPLTSPILISINGAIFNKSDVLRAIIDKTIPKQFSYLRKTKYLKEADLLGASSIIQYICPLSNKSPGAASTDVFVLLWKCGHIFHKQSYESICKDGNCPLCGEKNSIDDIVELDSNANHEFDRIVHEKKC